MDGGESAGAGGWLDQVDITLTKPGSRAGA